MESLELVRTWPVDNVAAAVVTPDGRHGSVGDTERVFALASVTKLLVAYGALIAVEEGAIDLDQPAGPDGSTVRHLLAHTSGLAFDERRVLAGPGTRRIYSSAGFEMLAELIGEESGIAFPDYLREAVFEPLDMTSSALTGSAGHGAESSVADLARFAAELLTPTLLDPQTLADATTVQFPGLPGVLPGYGSQRPNDWGLGFELRDGKSPHWTGSHNSPKTYGHFGQAGTFLWVDATLAGACVVLTDRAFGDWAKPLWPELSDRVVDEIGD
ncbi:beta-lactamase family protein [Aldersonia sp. NBC_00410]|uniref:serine hydrolase domain-containing protein n=1 Tax=Aldersonia sp. NBC_00410 TaxID=2975954 RepID=UPI00224FECF4|nr:serine hydrolase domain-containing protein [Aldersonia sp. NBC_00410]MCX5042667.1 beta-lactamase family protein [Aldersonia sp. NBC_00410]